MRAEGWNWLWNSRKWHWFGQDGRSLCRRFLLLGTNRDAQHGNDSSPDNCAECARRLAKQQSAVTSGASAPAGETGA